MISMYRIPLGLELGLKLFEESAPPNSPGPQYTIILVIKTPTEGPLGTGNTQSCCFHIFGIPVGCFSMSGHQAGAGLGPKD